MAPSYNMHIDINSCFATIEQQANPLLRFKPVAVAARDTPRATIVAASYEAKKFGVKTGTRVDEAKIAIPNIIIITPDPAKYRDVHLKIKFILDQYTNVVFPRSIDEFLLNFEGTGKNVFLAAQEIKLRIKKEVGEYISTSIGIGPSRFLAKTASNIKKPDGLELMDRSNYLKVYADMELKDLYGINTAYSARLGSVGIYSVLDFYNAPIDQLYRAFKSVGANYWFYRLRGYEVDDIESGRKSFGNSFVLPRPVDFKDIGPLLMKLVVKSASRLRSHGYRAGGLHIGVLYKDGTYWHRGRKLSTPLFDERDIYRELYKMMSKSPYNTTKKIKKLSESCFGLAQGDVQQLEMFADVTKKVSLMQSLDDINDKFGDFTLTPARMLPAKHLAGDSIGFGKT